MNAVVLAEPLQESAISPLVNAILEKDLDTTGRKDNSKQRAGETNDSVPIAIRGFFFFCFFFAEEMI